MFFVDEPYISDFIKITLKENNIPVVNTEISKSLGLFKGTNIITENEAVKL